MYRQLYFSKFYIENVYLLHVISLAHIWPIIEGQRRIFCSKQTRHSRESRARVLLYVRKKTGFIIPRI